MFSFALFHYFSKSV